MKKRLKRIIHESVFEGLLSMIAVTIISYFACVAIIYLIWNGMAK